MPITYNRIGQCRGYAIAFLTIIFFQQSVVFPQCPNDNIFWVDLTPPSCPGSNYTSCIFGGEYVTVSVRAEIPTHFRHAVTRTLILRLHFTTIATGLIFLLMTMAADYNQS
ncbi:MAG: hypothetical protein HYY40_08170 [Bacteroidetes bacterium]|nr:hypothetical protein [Bacteroidota bacterium]